MGTAGLVAVVVGEEDPFDLVDAEVGQGVGNGAVPAVEQQGCVAGAEDADVDGAAVDVEVGGELNGFGGVGGRSCEEGERENDGDIYC